MPLSSSEAAQYCQDLYNGAGHFDVFSGCVTDHVYVGCKVSDQHVTIVFRGSTTPIDWIRDFRFCMVDRPGVGRVEDGFYDGIPRVFNDLHSLLAARKVFIVGHSLGAARALLFAGLLGFKQYAVSGVIVFGCPNPAGMTLKLLLQDARMPIWAYENHADPFLRVPVALPRVPYQKPYTAAQTVRIAQKPAALDLWGPFAPHHMELYQAGAVSDYRTIN